MKIVIVDLDGTLADIEHRRHLVNGETQDWHEFYRQCVNDKPIEQVIKIVTLLATVGFKIVIMSGRSMEVRQETVAWLDKYKIPCFDLLMRPEGNYIPDEELKALMLEKFDINDIYMVIDDRKKVVNMWRSKGLFCIQVAEGNF